MGNQAEKPVQTNLVTLMFIFLVILPQFATPDPNPLSHVIRCLQEEWDLIVTSDEANAFSFQRNLSNRLFPRGGRTSLLRFPVVAELPAGCHGDSGLSGGACALEEEGTRPASGDEERACVGGQTGAGLGQGERGSRVLVFLATRSVWGSWCEMEAGAAAEDGPDGPRERRGLDEAGRQQQNHEVRSQSRADRFPKHSYWLDLWLFILFDVVLFIFVYLLP
ncbi:uncharacterized protein C4orf3 homolog [Mustela putorius furo]|uniref:Uncharacterized protein C4orf3 homolog n=1 Tax=Mustela putorius furo TaxID=9669 RepID=A0A8U0NR09_MUSPF|nr:uncharacterized protein C4orf3 homolog [Mustela putorius furo]